MRPPFLTLGGEENFSVYQNEFDRLLPSGLIDVLGNTMIFGRDRCHHICFKPEDKRWNKGLRDNWRQDRAERIPWIKVALESPNFIRISTGKIWAYLLEVKADKQNGLLPELFVAIVNSNDVSPRAPGNVHFITAYTITIQEWNEFKKNRPWIYPPGEPKPRKQKNKRA